MTTPENAAVRVQEARSYATTHALVYVPCFRKAPDGQRYDPHPLDAPAAIRLLIAAGHVPADTLERWYTGELLEALRLALCVHCRCNPVANLRGQCWWCDHRPWSYGGAIAV